MFLIVLVRGQSRGPPKIDALYTTPFDTIEGLAGPRGASSACGARSMRRLAMIAWTCAAQELAEVLAPLQLDSSSLEDLRAEVAARTRRFSEPRPRGGGGAHVNSQHNP